VPAAGPLQQSDRPLTIGNHPSWNAYAGDIDEVRVFGQALSADQVATSFAPAWVGGTPYAPGDVVLDGHSLYQCKPWPYSGWCSAGGAYEPGVGWASADAWTLVRSCGYAPTTDAGTDSGSAACSAAYAQSNCLAYQQGTQVSRNGRNWTCTNGNCMNCAVYAACEPGGMACPWGVVWTDDGACGAVK
jgi:hypothetical protein